MRKYAALAVVLVAVAACQDSTSPNPIAAAPARVSTVQNVGPNDYIVTLRADESDPDGAAQELVNTHGGNLKYVYRTALKGFAVSSLPDAAVQALARNPRVASIERDGIVTADQDNATWGLDRIDQRDLPLDTKYNFDTDGTGVTAYIIDTGIRTTHVEFGGRATGGFTAINDGNGSSDCHGHGTHVAGTVGGTTYGVAKNVTLVAVRVLDCSGSGSNSGVIAGIDYVTQTHQADTRAVANMSLGGGLSSALNTAVTNSIADGVVYAVAAGNENTDACTKSPASTPNAITVGATASNDSRATFSNKGTCVDINAPGVSVTSSWGTGDTAINTISGTSMATPHVTGAAALYLAGHAATTTPAEVDAALKASATPNKITGLTGTNTPNLLLYTHFTTPTDPPPTGSPPVASISKSCNIFVCTFTSTSAGVTDPLTWAANGGTNPTVLSATQFRVTYAARSGGTVTLTATNADGSDTATSTVTCNPKKCQ